MHDVYLLFECTLYNMFIYPFEDQGMKMELPPFFIMKEHIQQGMFKWPTHLQPLPTKEIATLEMRTKRNQYHKKVEIAQQQA
jgi:hypothetical protein